MANTRCIFILREYVGDDTSDMSCDETVTEVSFAREGATPGMAVLRAVAEREGVHPVDLSPISEAVPSPVVDGLFEGGSLVQAEFTYSGYDVAVLRDERVVVGKDG